MERDQRDDGKDAGVGKDEKLWLGAVGLSGPVLNVGMKSDEECAGGEEGRRGRMWKYGAVAVEACNGMSPDGVRPSSEKAKIGVGG